MTFLIKTNYNTSFREKLEEQLAQTIDTNLSELYKQLKNPVPMELGIKILTSIVLNIAEYSYQSPEKVNKEEIAETIFKIILQGPVRAMGFIK